MQHGNIRLVMGLVLGLALATGAVVVGLWSTGGGVPGWRGGAAPILSVAAIGQGAAAGGDVATRGGGATSGPGENTAGGEMEWLNVYWGLPLLPFWACISLIVAGAAWMAAVWIRDRLCLPSHPDMEEMLRGMYRQDRAKEE